MLIIFVFVSFAKWSFNQFTQLINHLIRALP